MTSQPGYRTITMHILPDFSRSKGNQTMKLGQLWYNKRNNFLRKSFRKWGSENSYIALSVFQQIFIRGKWSAA